MINETSGAPWQNDRGNGDFIWKAHNALGGALALYCSESPVRVPEGEFYLARLMYFPAGRYTFQSRADDFARYELNGELFFDAPGFVDTISGELVVAETGIHRLDVYYNQASGQGGSPAWVCFRILAEDGSVFYQSAGEFWSCGGLPPTDLEPPPIPVPPAPLPPPYVCPPHQPEPNSQDNMLDLPVFLPEPTWANGLLERYEWLTRVMVSESTSEQRSAARRWPRREFDADFALWDQGRRLLENTLIGVGGGQIVVPLWHYGTALTGSAEAGAVTLAGDFSLSDFKLGQPVIIRGEPALTEYFVARVREAGSLSLTLTRPTDRAWPEGTRIYPARICRIADASTMTLATSRAATTTIRFASVFPETDIEDESIFAQRHPDDGLPILEPRNNWRTAPSLAYTRQLLTVDNSVGIPTSIDIGGRAMMNQDYRITVHGRAEHDALRRLLYALRARLKAFWLPSLAEDINLLEDITNGGQSILIERNGYPSWDVGSQPLRQDLMITRGDGSRVFAHVQSAEYLADRNADRLTFSRPVGNITRAEIRSISAICHARLDQDTIEFQHLTDVEGAAESALTFKRLRNMRRTSTLPLGPFYARVSGRARIGATITYLNGGDISLENFMAAWTKWDEEVADKDRAPWGVVSRNGQRVLASSANTSGRTALYYQPDRGAKDYTVRFNVRVRSNADDDMIGCFFRFDPSSQSFYSFEWDASTTGGTQIGGARIYKNVSTNPGEYGLADLRYAGWPGPSFTSRGAATSLAYAPIGWGTGEIGNTGIGYLHTVEIALSGPRILVRVTRDGSPTPLFVLDAVDTDAPLLSGAWGPMTGSQGSVDFSSLFFQEVKKLSYSNRENLRALAPLSARHETERPGWLDVDIGPSGFDNIGSFMSGKISAALSEAKVNPSQVIATQFDILNDDLGGAVRFRPDNGNPKQTMDAAARLIANLESRR